MHGSTKAQKERIQQLLQQPKRSQEDTNEIIEHFVPLARRIADYYDVEDALSVSFFNLVTVCNRPKLPGDRTGLYKYLATTIRHSLIGVWRKANREYKPQSYSYRNEEELPPARNGFDLIEFSDTLSSNVQDKFEALIVAHIIRGHTHQEIANRLRVSRQYVSKIATELLERFRLHYQES